MDGNRMELNKKGIMNNMEVILNRVDNELKALKNNNNQEIV